jgi:hypothetical protein
MKLRCVAHLYCNNSFELKFHNKIKTVVFATVFILYNFCSTIFKKKIEVYQALFFAASNTTTPESTAIPEL